MPAVFWKQLKVATRSTKKFAYNFPRTGGHFFQFFFAKNFVIHLSMSDAVSNLGKMTL